MLSVMALRGRLPLIVFILLLVLCLLMLGFACACFSDQPMQAVDRALSGISAAPALVEVWAVITVLSSTAALMLGRPRLADCRASPPLLQRFLF